jgi:hypothetical protein
MATAIFKLRTILGHKQLVNILPLSFIDFVTNSVTIQKFLEQMIMALN